MTTFRAIKDPDAILDYSIDWTTWLDGDTISSASWVISADESPADVTVTSTSNTTLIATVWLSGGTIGQRYIATCHITTAGGRQDDRSIEIKVTSK